VLYVRRKFKVIVGCFGLVKTDQKNTNSPHPLRYYAHRRSSVVKAISIGLRGWTTRQGLNIGKNCRKFFETFFRRFYDFPLLQSGENRSKDISVLFFSSIHIYIHICKRRLERVVGRSICAQRIIH
jgi:hypothetical protein